MLVNGRKSLAAEIDWLGQAGKMSATGYRDAMLAKQTERDLQRDAVRWFRRMLPAGSKVIAIPNQRTVGHLPKAVQQKVLAALIADGMDPGACDLLFLWNADRGEPGNRGVALAELKRPLGAKPPRPEQIAFGAALTAMGHHTGIATSLEQIEDILIAAGAPLMARLPRPMRPAPHAPDMERAPPPASGDAPEAIKKGEF